MRNIDEIIIDKVLINYIDKENKRFFSCNSELELSDEIYEYFEKHILKCLKDEESKPGKFSEKANVVESLCIEIFENEDCLIDNGKKLTQYLFKCIQNDEAALSGDFVICIFQGQNGKFMALLKLDFNNCYMHFVKEEEGDIKIDIAKSQTGLPSTSQKIQKAVIIKEYKESNEYDMLVIDKEPEGYFMNSFLNCNIVRDSRENTKIIKAVSEDFARRAFKDNAHEAERFRNNISDKLRSEDRINIDKLVDESFKDEGFKEEYKSTLISEGIKEHEVRIDKEWAEKKLKRKRLKVDKDIELYIDSEAYNDKDKFQIKRNGDGTIDIIIKNIKNYIEK